ncbi:hypothetical protein M5689_002903 [Euphorbia peplus]|nr:hypothetical protein M5689_002903 [Euphorbia peplus]
MAIGQSHVRLDDNTGPPNYEESELDESGKPSIVKADKSKPLALLKSSLGTIRRRPRHLIGIKDQMSETSTVIGERKSISPRDLTLRVSTN